MRLEIVFNTLTSLVATLALFLHVTMTREAGESLVGICKWGDFARKTETERKKKILLWIMMPGVRVICAVKRSLSPFEFRAFHASYFCAAHI